MRTIIESPLKGDYERNKRYALWCLRDSLDRGEAPFASHIIYALVLDDRIAEQRERGMTAGFLWGDVAELVAFYEDLGRSGGMERSLARNEGKIPLAFRKLHPWALAQFLDGKVPEFT